MLILPLSPNSNLSAEIKCCYLIGDFSGVSVVINHMHATSRGFPAQLAERFDLAVKYVIRLPVPMVF